MEIIHIILGKANPDRMNGVNRVVHEMASNQVRLGYAVQVWGITAQPVHDYPERNFTTVLFRSYRNPFKAGAALKAALTAKKGTIVVHLHGAFLPRFYSLSVFLFRRQIPFIITPHSTYNKVMMKKNAFVKKIYFRFFEKKLLDRCACIHLLGKTEWEGLEEIYHNRKSVLIPYGFTPAAPAATREKAPMFTAAYCGRLSVFSKGLDIMIEGFSMFHKKYPRSSMLLIGDGSEKEAVLQLVKDSGTERAIVLTGGKFGNEKTALLQQCHVFVHPSRTDGLPATIVEAASLGLPCIVSAATNTGDFISGFDAGYLMPGLTAQHFCNGLEDQYLKIMQQGKMQLLQQNAVRMVEEAFNWQLVLNRFNGIYRTAFEQRSGSKNNHSISTHAEIAL